MCIRDRENNLYNIWDTMTFPVSGQVRYFRDFLLCEGRRYQELVPNAELVTPNKAGDPYGYRGWAYAAATPARDLLLGYAEKGCPRLAARGLRPYEAYTLEWFDPSTGVWSAPVELAVDYIGLLHLPAFPADHDWAFKLKKLDRPYRIDRSEHQRTTIQEYRKLKSQVEAGGAVDGMFTREGKKR